MRILVASDQWFPDVTGGVARLATESAERLAALGHEVTAIVPASGRATEDGAVDVHRVLRRGRLPQTLTDPGDTARAVRELGEGFDVVLGHNSTTAAGLADAAPNVPLVTFFHASAVLELDVLRERGAPARQLAAARALRLPLVRLERRSLDRAARVFALSRFSLGLLEQRSPAALGKAVLVPGAVDTDRFSPGDRAEARTRLGIADDERVVFTVRRLVPRMGLEELLAAGAALAADGVRLAVAGGGPLADVLERQRAASPRPEAISLLGRVDDDALVDWYRAADVVAVPTIAYEGFGLVTAEALAAGTPVVGTPVGATPELLEPLGEGLVAGGATAGDLETTLRDVLGRTSDALREKCRAYAVERFGWDNAAAAWERELVAAVEAGPAPQHPPRPRSMRELARSVDRRVPFDLKGVRNSLVAGTREGIGRTVRVTGIGGAVHRLGDHRKAGILLYHNPTPSTLSRHLEYLAQRHTFVTYDAVASAVATGDWSELPSRSLAVVLDDGHAGNVELLPTFRRFGIRPTIFICTAIVGTHRKFWFTVEGLPGNERFRLMSVPDHERLEALKQRGFTPEREYDGPPQALSLEEMTRLLPDVSFEAHTRSHPILTMCTDDQAAAEIKESKLDVERITGRACTAFAYPNGRYGEREVELVRAAGLTSARTIETGWNTPDTDPFRLRILGMPDDASLDVVAAQATGLPYLRDLMYLT
jgi:glycosyltransferase involved in cell wall biosynthesis/peptidoglycan/xylan/chitin deacetylase (PgdA/CDA1 family)